MKVYIQYDQIDYLKRQLRRLNPLEIEVGTSPITPGHTNNKVEIRVTAEIETRHHKKNVVDMIKACEGQVLHISPFGQLASKERIAMFFEENWFIMVGAYVGTVGTVTIENSHQLDKVNWWVIIPAAAPIAIAIALTSLKRKKK